MVSPALVLGLGWKSLLLLFSASPPESVRLEERVANPPTAVDIVAHAPDSDARVAFHPLSEGTPVRARVVVQPGRAPVFVDETQTESAVEGEIENDTEGEPAGGALLLFSNTLASVAVGSPSSNVTAMLADDLGLTVEPGCLLDRYVFRVTGNLTGSATEARPLRVNFGLYSDCPRGGGVLLAGTDSVIDLPDAEVYTVVFQLSADAEVPLPGTPWLGISFDRGNAGIIFAGPALTGFSQDGFDHPSFTCAANLGLFPNGPHAGFFAQVYGRGECVASHLGYRALRPSGGTSSPSVNVAYADDLRLGVDTCELVAYEVHVRGSGFVTMDLRTELVDADPVEGGVILGTRRIVTATGTTPQLIRVDLDPPIPLGGLVWFAFRSSSTTTGPVVSGLPAAFGIGQDFYMDHEYGRWLHADFANPQTHAAFDVTLWCKGAAPVGACCDLLRPDVNGEAVCRNVAQINCPANRWVEQASCENNPFDPPCGLAACCTPEDTCENLTRNQCVGLTPDVVLWQRSSFCGDGQVCPFHACLQRRGECLLPSEEVGCEDPFCCQEVCGFDPWCCQVEWDRACVDWAREFCPRPPPNDECFSLNDPGAIPVVVNSSDEAWNETATVSASDPAICCHAEELGAQGVGTVWFRFTATHTSARVSTCRSQSPADDSLLMVFGAADPTTLESACASLVEFGCNDDRTGCGPGGGNSELCVDGLMPGETYYIMVAAKSEANVGNYLLDVSAPCEVSLPPIPNDRCENATPIAGAPIAVPFDLSGRESYASATFDCPGPECIEFSLKNDIWYDWTSPVTGIATFSTCGESDATTPDTGLVVYEGCGCPVNDAAVVGCNDFEFSPCFLGAAIRNLSVVGGQCYKIRLGGNLGSTPAGNLTITLSKPPAYNLLQSGPLCDATLPRLRGNVVRLAFNGPITAPNARQVLIQELLVGGEFGPDLSLEFAFALEPGSILKITDNADTFLNGRWYAIRNVGGWASTDPFEINYVVVFGDADGSGLCDFADLSWIFGSIQPGLDAERSDVDASSFVDFADISAAFASYGSSAPPKPDGHECRLRP